MEGEEGPATTHRGEKEKKFSLGPPEGWKRMLVYLSQKGGEARATSSKKKRGWIPHYEESRLHLRKKRKAGEALPRGEGKIDLALWKQKNVYPESLVLSLLPFGRGVGLKK